MSNRWDVITTNELYEDTQPVYPMVISTQFQIQESILLIHSAPLYVCACPSVRL